MYKGLHQAREYATQIRRLGSKDVDVVVCPPYVSLEATLQGLGTDSAVGVYAQNVHWELEGAYTGEVSPSMLAELGVTGSIVGHSERRQLFGETDETVRRRAEAALEAGLHVIACVGETEAERDRVASGRRRCPTPAARLAARRGRFGRRSRWRSTA